MGTRVTIIRVLFFLEYKSKEEMRINGQAQNKIPLSRMWL